MSLDVPSNATFFACQSLVTYTDTQVTPIHRSVWRSRFDVNRQVPRQIQGAKLARFEEIKLPTVCIEGVVRWLSATLLELLQSPESFDTLVPARDLQGCILSLTWTLILDYSRPHCASILVCPIPRSKFGSFGLYTLG